VRLTCVVYVDERGDTGGEGLMLARSPAVGEAGRRRCSRLSTTAVPVVVVGASGVVAIDGGVQVFWRGSGDELACSGGQCGWGRSGGCSGGRGEARSVWNSAQGVLYLWRRGGPRRCGEVEHGAAALGLEGARRRAR
jgi:hypothetical protein